MYVPYYLTFLACLVLNWKEIALKSVNNNNLVSPPMKLCFIALYLILDGMTFVIRSTSESDVSHFGHFSGFITGFFVGVIVLEDIKKEKWETALKIIMAITLLIFSIILIVMNATKVCITDD